MQRIALLLGPRTRVLLLIAAGAAWGVWHLGLDVRDLVPRAANLQTARDFFAAAAAPAIQYETEVPLGTGPLLVKVGKAIVKTVAFAVSALSLAFVGGLILALPASSLWWEGDPVPTGHPVSRAARRSCGPVIMWTTRIVIALLRSIHELLWAVLFLCVVGPNNLTAILAIAIPYTGVFAKVFSEMIDESPRDAAIAARGLGARPLSVFLYGILPRALPDMLAYGCYRFECGLRSSAVMGFFGILTLGYYLKAAFDDLHYRETWTYLYALIALVVVADWWSGMMRRRLVQ